MRKGSTVVFHNCSSCSRPTDLVCVSCETSFCSGHCKQCCQCQQAVCKECYKEDLCCLQRPFGKTDRRLEAFYEKELIHCADMHSVELHYSISSSCHVNKWNAIRKQAVESSVGYYVENCNPNFVRKLGLNYHLVASVFPRTAKYVANEKSKHDFVAFITQIGLINKQVSKMI